MDGADPVFGTFAASTMGNDNPRLVESKMFTVVVLIGLLAVPATSQVTVRNPDQLTAVFGAVTRNGPALLTDVTEIWSSATPPPPARLSRTVSRNCIVRLVVGSFS